MGTQFLHYLFVPWPTRGLRAALLITAAVMLAAAGCGQADDGRVQVFPVRGQIQFKGHSPIGAFIVLHPKGGVSLGAPSPRAMVGPDGTFVLGTYDGQDGAPAGEYVLTIQWNKLVKQKNEVVSGPNVLPAKFATPRTSDIKITVASSENYLKPIHLR